METIFKEGDRVFHYHYGWGTIKSISYDDRAIYPVPVNFDTSDSTWFTCDGRELDCEKPSLSFTEYTLEGFSQERPEELPKKGDVVWVRDNNDEAWQVSIFFKKEGMFYLCTRYDPEIESYVQCWDQLTTKNPYKNEQ